MTTKLTKSQKKTFVVDSGSKHRPAVTVDGVSYRKVVAEVRFDGKCNNGHNTFAITGSAWIAGRRINLANPDVCGCIHEIIAVAFPELKPFIKWHLCATDGPMYYVANTTYLARTCSHPGKKPGDPIQFERVVTLGNSSFPIKFSPKVVDFLEEAQKLGWRLGIKEVPHKNTSMFGSKYTFDTHDCLWSEAPFDCLDDAQRFVSTYHEVGMTIVSRPIKFATVVKPDLEAARNCALWPEATLAQLQSEEALLARLPSLLEEFKADIESLGFEW